MITKRYAVDRVVEGIVVLIPDDRGDELQLPKEKYNLSTNDIVDITFSDGKVIKVEKDDAERQRRLERATSRLQALFNRKKK